MNRIFLPLLLLISSTFIFAQSSQNHIDSLGRKQGFWVKTDTSGRKVYEGQFTDGLPFGLFRYYYPDGKIKTESVISAGGKKAKTISYYPNGKKMAAGNYLNERKDSTWLFFSEKEGILVSEEVYNKGNKDGISKTFYPDGQLAEILTWKNGLKSGLWEQYYTDGKIKFRGHYTENEKTGLFEAFYMSGKIMYKVKYTAGHATGQWIYYDENGKILKKEEN